jgi:hypothetical protein
MTDATAAIPVRFWWLKRLTAAGIFLLFVMLGLRIWWGWIAQRRLDAVIAEARALGEPTQAEDFAVTGPLPSPDQNAVPLLKAAVASAAFNPAQTAFNNRFDPTLFMSDEDRKMLHGLVTANVKAITLARRAADKSDADWGIRLTNPIYTAITPSFRNQVQLATLMRNSALDNHIRGDDAQALKDIRAIFQQGRVLDDAGPFLLAHLASAAVDQLAAETVRQIVGELRIGDVGASPQQARDLIRSFLNDQNDAAIRARGWYLERAELFQAPSQMSASLTGLDYWEYVLIKPIFVLDMTRRAQDLTIAAHAVHEPNFPSAAKAPPSPTSYYGISPLHTLAHFYYYISAPRISNNFAFNLYRELTERRVAAVLLAARLYETDHGSPPLNLAALVPDYLPQVPIDPLSPDDHVLQYVSTAGKQAVYSVGIDGHDDGGSTQLPAPASGQSSNPWNMRDAVFPLHPATAP